jgi:drug/metabolite transporter (DMT)-like permease
MLVLLLSFASALCFAAGFVLQYHEAHETPENLFLSPRVLLELLKHRLWLAGIAAMFVGDGLQAWALAKGSLAVVEPVLTTSLLFALPLSAAWRREKLRREEWTGALCVSLGLGLLLGVGSPSMGGHDMPGYRWLLVVLASCGAALTMIAAGRRAPWASTRAALIGGAAGVLFGLQDALTRFCLYGLSHDFVGLVFSWQPYLLLVVGIYGLALTQSAYRAGSLTSSLPPIAVGEPVVGMLIGVFALNEHLASSSPALAFEAIGGVVMIAGTWVLGRSPLVCGKLHPQRLRRIEARLLHEQPKPVHVP